MEPLIFLIILCFLSSVPPLFHCQQPYEGPATTDCNNQHNSTSLLGYFCNGQTTSCQTYITFHSQTSYQTVNTISALLSSDTAQLSEANSVLQNATFALDTKVLVPVNCSCSSAYYQYNTSYRVREGDTALIIANSTFQGLSTCQAIAYQSINGAPNSLKAGVDLTVPLRCACPTSEQTSNGVKYLVSYLVDTGNTLFSISQSFGVSIQAIQDANNMSDTNIYPFTTLLIPLENTPNVSQLISTSTTPTTSPPAQNGGNVNHKAVYVGVGVGVAVFVLILIASIVVFFVFRTKKRKPGKDIRADDSEMFGTSFGMSDDKKLSGDVLSGISEIGKALKVYKFEELQLATENFSYECHIEGSVYRGIFNGDVAAVKMMNRDVSKEIEILKKINHFNLVKLSGICFNKGHWYLVYQYASNGSLNNWIFDTSGSKVLSWIQRMQIALDVANGLNYLHCYIEPPCVHKDIKSSNILLDESFRAKIANFNLARNTEDNEGGQFALTRHIIGTQGYMAPEYLEHGLISPKLDVYAFGVVMLEMITGKNAVEARKDVLSADALASIVAENDAVGKLESLIDPALQGNYQADAALFMFSLIEKCLRKDAGSRPSMEEIEQSLSKIFALSVSGQRPTENT